MPTFTHCVIQSFKHDGHLHRTWLDNWLVPKELHLPAQLNEHMIVCINAYTKVREADGKMWTSRIPAVSYFIPDKWFNVVALIEQQGIRYYCNIASPPVVTPEVLSYVDYDLDVIKSTDGRVLTVDQHEYEQHKKMYNYPFETQQQVEAGLAELKNRIAHRASPFDAKVVHHYYQLWHHQQVSRKGRNKQR